MNKYFRAQTTEVLIPGSDGHELLPAFAADRRTALRGRAVLVGLKDFGRAIT